MPRRHHGPLALVHFGSHQDSLSGNDGRNIFHGTFAYDLATEGSADPSRSTQAFICTEMPNDNGHDILYAHETFCLDPREVVERINASVGDAPVYITFDIDALDPAYAPLRGRAHRCPGPLDRVRARGAAPLEGPERRGR